MTKTLKIDRDKRGIVRVALNRPDTHNALNDEMIRELTETFAALGRDSDARIIVLSGAGKSFCAGADLGHMQRLAGLDEAENRADAERMADMFATINACPKPVVGLIYGAVMGGGVGLVACCDIAVAKTEALFSLSEVRLGLIPATISPFVVAKIGQGAARRYMLSAERFDATMARSLGLVHEVADDIEAAAQPIITALLHNGPHAMADTKALIAEVAGRPLAPELSDLTAQRIAARRASAEGREGMAAFLEKRKPRWQADD